MSENDCFLGKYNHFLQSLSGGNIGTLENYILPSSLKIVLSLKTTGGNDYGLWNIFSTG